MNYHGTADERAIHIHPLRSCRRDDGASAGAGNHSPGHHSVHGVPAHLSGDLGPGRRGPRRRGPPAMAAARCGARLAWDAGSGPRRSMGSRCFWCRRFEASTSSGRSSSASCAPVRRSRPSRPSTSRRASASTTPERPRHSDPREHRPLRGLRGESGLPLARRTRARLRILADLPQRQRVRHGLRAVALGVWPARGRPRQVPAGCDRSPGSRIPSRRTSP